MYTIRSSVKVVITFCSWVQKATLGLEQSQQQSCALQNAHDRHDAKHLTQAWHVDANTKCGLVQLGGRWSFWHTMSTVRHADAHQDAPTLIWSVPASPGFKAQEQ